MFLYVVDACRQKLSIKHPVYFLLLDGFLGMLHPQCVYRGVLRTQLILVDLLGLLQAIAATSLGKSYLQSLFRLLLLQDAMFLRGLLSSIHLIVWTSCGLLLTPGHLAHWYVVILLADEWEVHILEFPRIELTIQTAWLSALWGTGIRE